MREDVRLAAEYGCYPLWKPTESGMDNIPSSNLPISRTLADAVEDWGNEYESTYDPEDPMSSGFSSSGMENDFIERGRQIAHQLAVELGPAWQVAIRFQGLRSVKS